MFFLWILPESQNFREEQIPIDPGEKGAPEWPHYTWHAVHLQGQTLCHSSSSKDPYLPPHEDGADDEGWGGFQDMAIGTLKIMWNPDKDLVLKLEKGQTI